MNFEGAVSGTRGSSFKITSQAARVFTNLVSIHRSVDVKELVPSWMGHQLFRKQEWFLGRLWTYINWLFFPLMGQSVQTKVLSDALKKTIEVYLSFTKRLENSDTEVSEDYELAECMMRNITVFPNYENGLVEIVNKAVDFFVSCALENDSSDIEKMRQELDSPPKFRREFLQKSVEGVCRQQFPWEQIISLARGDVHDGLFDLDQFLRKLHFSQSQLCSSDILVIIYDHLAEEFDDGQSKAIAFLRIISYLAMRDYATWLLGFDRWHEARIHQLRKAQRFCEVPDCSFEEELKYVPIGRLDGVSIKHSPDGDCILVTHPHSMADLFMKTLRYFEQMGCFYEYFDMLAIGRFGQFYFTHLFAHALDSIAWTCEEMDRGDVFARHKESLACFFRKAVDEKKIPVVKDIELWGFLKSADLRCLVPCGAVDGSFVDIDELIWAFCRADWKLYRQMYCSSGLASEEHATAFPTSVAICLQEGSLGNLIQLLTTKGLNRSDHHQLGNCLYRNSVEMIRRLERDRITNAKERFISWLKVQKIGFRLPPYEELRMQLEER